jgi:hypothetical protein
MNTEHPLPAALIAIVIGLMFLIAPAPAHAQRCPAGQDAFLNCLPLDHRYGGPGAIQRWRPTPESGRAHDISNPSFQKCMAHLDPATCRRLWGKRSELPARVR